MKKNNLKQLCLVFCFLASKSAFSYDFTAKNADNVTIYYNYINEGKELEVTNNGDYYNTKNSYKGNVKIPETVTINGRERKVTSIGEYAFRYCSGLTSITIPNSVTRIGNEAFVGTGLTSVHISDLAAWCKIPFTSVVHLWNNSQVTYSNPLYYAHHLFLNGQEIKELVIPNSVTSIGGSAFIGCYDFTSVTIPNSVTSIGGSAFEGCSGLTSVTIGNSVTSIGSEAFYGCSGLTSISIPNSVTSIGKKAFVGTGLTSVHISDLAAWCKISFNDNPLSYAHHLFLNGQEIKDLVIPNSVTSIGSSAFYGCSGLTSVAIPSSVTSIAQDAFKNCTGLTSVHISDLAAWCKISFNDNPLSYAHHLFLNGQEIKDLVIPNSVTSIGDFAFYSCSGLTSVTIGNSVTSIGNYAFMNCSGLKSVTIPNSVTSIGSRAFNFTNSNNDVLVEIISLIENPTSETGCSFSTAIYNNATLYVPVGTMAKYKQTQGWKKFIWIEEGIPTGIAPVKQEKIGSSDISSDTAFV